jgi:hypothetical protein
MSIHDRSAIAQSQSSKMVERLRNSNGNDREYVRHLEIGPIRNEDWFQSEIMPVLGEVLRSIDNLSGLTWHMNCAPSPAILHLFHELHPSAHLHLILRDRKFKPLTRDLLAFPQLYTLDTEIYRTLPESTGHSLSELSFIKNNLASSTRVLRFSSRGVHAYPQRAQFEEWGSVNNSMYNLDFQPGDPFPALSELALEHDEFFLTEENCRYGRAQHPGNSYSAWISIRAHLATSSLPSPTAPPISNTSDFTSTHRPPINYGIYTPWALAFPL